MDRNVLIGLVVFVLVLGTVGLVVATYSKVQGGKAEAPQPPGSPGPAMAGPPGDGAGMMRPGAGGQGAGAGGQRGREGAVQLLQRAGGTPEDGEKLEAFNEKRQQAIQGLRDTYATLREVTMDETAADQQVTEALAAFEKQRDQAKADLDAARKALEIDLDLADRPRLKAALTVAGILDGGVPMGGRGMGQRRGGGDASGSGQGPGPVGEPPAGS